MIKVGFDAQATQGRLSGLGVSTCSLLTALKQQICLPFELHTYSTKLKSGENLNTIRRLWWENQILPAKVKHDKMDILHVPAFSPPFHKPCRLVVTVHDIAGLLFRNQMGAASLFYWKHWLPLTIRQADRIIASSEHTKKDLIEHLRIPEDKIHVIYLSGHEGFTHEIAEEKLASVKKKLGIIGKYFVFVGTLEPRKNLARIMETFNIFSKMHPDYQLVLVGSKEFARGKYAELLNREQHFLPGQILTPGFVDHASLNALYCGAQALLFPSLYEGFGMPILEAMASGCPVMTSRITSTPEVAGNAGLLVDPYNMRDILQGMISLAESTSLCLDMRLLGLEQIKKFSWNETAKNVIDVYTSLI